MVDIEFPNGERVKVLCISDVVGWDKYQTVLLGNT